MATILIASIVVVPIVLLIGDLFRGKNRQDDAHASYGQQLNG
jgi:hypothetical protein